MMNELPKYLVRPHDYAVWERFKDTDLYRTYEKPGKEIKNRQDPYDNWTHENLLGHGFYPIEESQLEEYLEKWSFEISFYSWQSRNDGHGGAKGGTRAEYLDYLERVKAFNEKYPDWKKERDKRIEKAKSV